MASFQYGQIVEQLAVTATSGGTTSLTNSSKAIQVFTGSSSQTVVLPDATTLSNGVKFELYNQSSVSLTIQFNGGAAFTDAASVSYGTLNPHTTLVAKLQTNGTSAGTWSVQSSATSSSAYNAIWPNYISANNNAESGTTAGWATYADAAGNIPVDGTGGSATGLTFSASTSSPLRGSDSFSMVQANSTSLQGKGVSFDFTIDSADKAQPLSISMDYNASTTFVASDGITAPLNDGTTTTNAGNSDIEVFIYDVTNSVLLPVSPEVFTAKGSNNFTFNGTFQTSSNSTSYRLILHVATTSANATGWTFKFDNVYVGRQQTVQGVPAIDWDSRLVFTYTSFGTVSANAEETRRVGDSMEIRGTFTSGTPTAVAAQINLPSGYSLDTTKFNGSGQKVVGWMAVGTTAQNNFASSSSGPFPVFYDGSTTSALFIADKQTAGTLEKSTGSNFAASGSIYKYNISVPITGWSSNVQMSNAADTRVVAASYYATSGSAPGSGNPFNFDGKIFDTHSAVTTGASWKFTAPVAGIYNLSVVVEGLSNTDMYVYKNGVQTFHIAEGGVTGGLELSAGNSVLVSMVPGDFIDVRPTSASSFTAGSSPYHSFISINRLSGPAALAASDTVACSYYVSANFAASTTVPVNFDTKQYDRTGSVTTSATAWKFTAPISGIYSVKCFSGASGAIVAMNIYKNGSVDQGIVRVDNVGGLAGGAIDMYLLAGDYIDIRPNAAKTIYGGATPGSSTSMICISRIGN